MPELKRLRIHGPTLGLDVRASPVALDPRAAADIQNMQTGPELDVLRKRSGVTRVGTNLPLNGAVMLLDQFWKMSGEQWPIVVTTTNVYYYDFATSSWVDISPTGGLHGTLDDPVFADIVADKFIFTNGIDPIMQWTGPGVPCSQLPDTTFKARCVRKFKERLIALGDPVDPQIVRWTTPGMIGSYWTDPGSGWAYLTEGVDWVVAGELIGDAMVVYKERSLVLCTYIGGDTVFRFDTIVSGIGAPAPKAILNLGNEHIFLAWDNIYEYQGGRSVDPIGDPVQESLLAFSNPQAIRRSHAVVVEERNEIWFFIAGASEIPDFAWVYNYATGRWYKHALKVTASGYWDRQHDMTLGQVSGTIGEQTARFGDRTFLALSPLVALGTDTGLVLQVDPTVMSDDALPIPAFWESKEFDGDAPESMKRWLGVEFEANAQHVVVDARVDSGDWRRVADIASVVLPSVELYPSQTLYPRMEVTRWKRFKADFDLTGRTLQLRFGEYGASVDFAIRSIEPKFMVTGRAL